MPTPVTREFLLTLKAKKDEEKRMKGVYDRVNHIYSKTLDSAGLCSDTFYKFRLTHQERHGDFTFSDTFYRETNNMADILVGVQRLFPDCFVTRVNTDSAFECIIIDWTLQAL